LVISLAAERRSKSVYGGGKASELHFNTVLTIFNSEKEVILGVHCVRPKLEEEDPPPVREPQVLLTVVNQFG
jgi:hypothetical protein